MQGQGLFVANEIHSKRAWELAGNLERWGATNVAITNETPERLAERFEGFFDRVLVDAPCSGEGMMRKGEAARVEWAPELVRGCALRQNVILEQAARLVRPGGRLVYSTCTFNPEENEGAVARFLAAQPDFTLEEPPQRPGFAAGRPEWLTETGIISANLRSSAVSAFNSSVPDVPIALSLAVRLWPHLAPGEGHFVALLRRRDGPALPPPRSWRLTRLPRPAEQDYRDFCAAHLTASPAANAWRWSAPTCMRCPRSFRTSPACAICIRDGGWER